MHIIVIIRYVYIRTAVVTLYYYYYSKHTKKLRMGREQRRITHLPIRNLCLWLISFTSFSFSILFAS